VLELRREMMETEAANGSSKPALQVCVCVCVCVCIVLYCMCVRAR
jgi:hypothetical protein